MESIIETGRRIAESYNRKGEGFDNCGKKNAYECEDCGSHIVTIDRHPGITPFLTRCGNCKGMAKSKMYRVADWLEPTHEWFRPEMLEDVPAGSSDHIARGGLILRPIGDSAWPGSIASKAAYVDSEREHARLVCTMERLEKREMVGDATTRQQRRHAARKAREAPEEISMYGHRYRRIDA